MKALCFALRELVERFCRDHHDPVIAIHQGVPLIRSGAAMSKPFNLPFDEIGTVKLFGTRASGAVTSVIAGSTVTSDNPTVVVTLAADSQSYTVASTAKPTTPPTVANITLSPPAGSTVPADVAQCTVIDDSVVSQGQDTANATFAPNPTPPTA
jgi:hypothetical protein